MSGWSGRKVKRLVQLVLQVKGTTCHLCGLPGANSADHDPPRSVLVASGVLNPDDPIYLFPSHLLPCNKSRGARPITDDLRAELRAKREAWLAGRPASSPSPRFLRARAVREGSPARSISGRAEKNLESR